MFIVGGRVRHFLAKFNLPSHTLLFLIAVNHTWCTTSNHWCYQNNQDYNLKAFFILILYMIILLNYTTSTSHIYYAYVCRYALYVWDDCHSSSHFLIKGFHYQKLKHVPGASCPCSKLNWCHQLVITHTTSLCGRNSRCSCSTNPREPSGNIKSINLQSHLDLHKEKQNLFV